MKKIMSFLLSLAVVTSICTVSAFADNSGTPRRNRSAAPCTGFVDTDGDGVCDNKGTGLGKNRCGNYSDEDGDGFCDTCGTRHGTGQGADFTDEDGDGICDNAGCGNGSGRGNGYGQGCGISRRGNRNR